MHPAFRVISKSFTNHRNSLFLFSTKTITSTATCTSSIQTFPAMSSSSSENPPPSAQDEGTGQSYGGNHVRNTEERVEENSTKPSKYAGTGFSVFGQGITKIHDVPMNIIRRPIPSELDEEKVDVFMKEVARGDEFTPIEVLRVRDPSDPSKSYYYSVGGCHRFEAHKRLEKETIRGKIIEVPAGVMRPYLVNPPF